MPATAASAHAPVAPSAPFLARRPVWQVSYLAAWPPASSSRPGGWPRAPPRADDSCRPWLAPRDAGHRRHVRDGDDGRHVRFTFAVILMARFSKNPRRTYLRTALPLLALSLAVPITAADTATSTKLTLAAAHLIAGAIIIPVVARRLSRPR